MGRSSNYIDTNSTRTDTFTRILILIGWFFTVAALTLSIVGIATRYWYYSKDSTGVATYYNFFTQCVSFDSNQTSTCYDIQRQTDFGFHTENAAAVLIVAICLLGCGLIVTTMMIFIHLTGILVFIAPIVLFLAALFIVVTFIEASKVSTFNSYSAILVQTAHILTIFSACVISLASGRLHYSSYQQI